MALGTRCTSMKIRRAVSMSSGDDLKLEFVRNTRSFGRKRVVIENNEDVSFCVDDSGSPRTPLKRFCSGRFDVVNVQEPVESYLESLPQHFLIKILCGVDHDDLKQLVHVSKSIREATKIAEKSHFAYSTPRKIQAFRTPVEYKELSELEDVEAPNAPLRQMRSYKSRLNKKNVTDISVALFT